MGTHPIFESDFDCLTVMSTVRRRKVTSATSDSLGAAFRHLDAFPKVTTEAEGAQTVHGALCTCVALLLMSLLFISEVALWVTTTNIKYEFDVDTDFGAKLNLNFDLTVSASCSAIGADIIDSSGDAWRYMVQVNEEATDFQQSDEQRAERQELLKLKSALEHEGGLSKALLRSGHNATHLERAMAANVEAAKVESHKIIHIRQGGDTPSGCRFWGSIPLNKVAGNFHIIPGKAIPHPMGHAHMNFFGAERFNFSHRIDHFSFGSPTSGLLYPLDGDVVIQSEENEQFNYIINVVPTH